MLLSLFESYGSFIRSWSVDEFESAGPNLKLKGTILFKDDSKLYFKQIVLGDLKFKYAYHWENENAELICRWDNAPHWPIGKSVRILIISIQVKGLPNLQAVISKKY